MGKILPFKQRRRRDRQSDRNETAVRRGPATALIVTGGLLVGILLGCGLVFGPKLLAHGQIEGPSYQAEFGFCHEGGGENCVVDGDTFWLSGERVRIMDIDAPETHPPRCAREAELGERATNRLHELLNLGPFQMANSGEDTDQYGRKLRVVARDGKSLGLVLVDEGLARRWSGSRMPWC